MFVACWDESQRRGARIMAYAVPMKNNKLK